MRIIGLIPARKNSKRVPGKNMALLNGKPLLQYAIEGAKESKIFLEIVVSTDWDECIELAENPGINAIRRPDEFCLDTSHDYEWVNHAINAFPGFDIFIILRPTSPFRTGETIKRAMDLFLAEPQCDSLRAIEPTRAHPGKSWIEWEWDGKGIIKPYTEVDGYFYKLGVSSFDLPTQSLHPVYSQNGCIHIAWTKTLEKYGNVSGVNIKGYVTQGDEGVDINTLDDLAYAEWIMKGRP